MIVSSRDGDLFQYLVEHGVFGDAFGLGFVAEDDAVAEAGVEDGFDIVGGDGLASFEPGAGARGAVEGEGAAGAGPDAEPLGKGGIGVERVDSVVIDGRAVLFDPLSQRVVELDEIATTWWQLLDGTPLDEIVAEVAGATAVDHRDVRSTASRFVDEFGALQLLDND